MTRRHGVLAAALLLGAAGCLSLKPQPDPARFYVLSATVPEPSARQPGTLVGLGPVTVPGYLRASQLVTRYGPNELDLHETARWGEPFGTMAARVLLDDLERALGAEQGVLYPWTRTLAPSPVIEVAFERFERDSAGAAILDARWRVRAGGTARTGATSLVEPAEGVGNDAAVAALSRALGRLAEEIAAAARPVAAAP
ncbi:MAG TPA: PqiC family protein [Gemmatimonadales bacterium]|nr:PqiC family protein [Gemmatimonadales bacterium]